MGIGFPTHSSGFQALLPNVDHLPTEHKEPQNTSNFAYTKWYLHCQSRLEHSVPVYLETRPTLCVDFELA